MHPGPFPVDTDGPPMPRHPDTGHRATSPGGVPVQKNPVDPARRPPAHHLDDEPHNQHRHCAARQMDLEELRAHGGTFRSGYRHLLGGDAPRCRPGDRETAKQFLARVEQAQQRGGWSSAERTRLSRLQRKWAKRASGQDSRFMVMGTRGGRATDEEARRIQEWGRVTGWQTTTQDARRRTSE